MKVDAGDGYAGLYLHVPFCSAICPYCDFAVLVDRAAPRASWVEQIGLELDRLAADGVLDGPLAGPYDTIYLGGGTPSLLTSEQLQAVLERVRASLTVTPEARLFLEANPEDVDDERLTRWRDAGVATVSLGVQSFDDEALRFLGRRHDAARARDAVTRTLDAGFDVVSVDLMYGLPDQSAAAWASTLDRAIALAPHHLSCYQLTVEPGTVFGQQHARGALEPLDDAGQAARFRATHTTLEAAGYTGYEVSNFARADRYRSAHNQKYWWHVPYLGLGPSAHSFDGHERWWNERHLARYGRRLREGRSPIAGRERPTPDQLALEALMLGLRTVDGLDLERFRDRYGVDLRQGNERRIADLHDRGWLHADTDHLRLTLDGRAVVDAITADWQMPAVG